VGQYKREREGGLAMLERLRRFWSDEEGPTAVEYAIMLAGIAVVIIAVVFLLGGAVKDTMTNVENGIRTGK
jgi:pilus assembly protein Flp/PilA